MYLTCVLSGCPSWMLGCSGTDWLTNWQSRATQSGFCRLSACLAASLPGGVLTASPIHSWIMNGCCSPPEISQTWSGQTPELDSPKAGWGWGRRRKGCSSSDGGDRWGSCLCFHFPPKIERGEKKKKKSISNIWTQQKKSGFSCVYCILWHILWSIFYFFFSSFSSKDGRRVGRNMSE